MCAGCAGFGKDRRGDLTAKDEHLVCEVADLFLGTIAATKLEKVQQLARVHRHGQIGEHAIRQNGAGVFIRLFLCGNIVLSVSAVESDVFFRRVLTDDIFHL